MDGVPVVIRSPVCYTSPMTESDPVRSRLLEGMNPRQAEAVSAPWGHLVVVAGAGSGKTRVLIHRISWLIRVMGVHPRQVMAVTFTNKAAREMSERLEALGENVTSSWVGTFHGICLRMLYAHPAEAGLDPGFQIVDQQDQVKWVRQAAESLGMADYGNDDARKAASWISQRKEECLTPDEASRKHDNPDMIRLYAAYEELLAGSGLVDFSGILFSVWKMLRENPEILAGYRQRFRAILVDEFQDTNTVQYDIIRMVAGADASITIVGDQDQSIYGWRGAGDNNIGQFQRDYPDARTVVLDQNYRSTARILAAANGIISSGNRRGESGKSLWTDGDAGEPVRVVTAMDDRDEADWVASDIQSRHESEPYSSNAILYRTNARSRLIEQALIKHAIPYRVHGGLKFFERAEIKDMMAYLRVMVNPADRPSMERALSTPPRGVSTKTLDSVESWARANRVPLWDAIMAFPGDSARLRALRDFRIQVDKCRETASTVGLSEAMEELAESTGLTEYHGKSAEGESRLENLRELYAQADTFETELKTSDAVSFIAYATLEAGENGRDEGVDESGDAVVLMTIHASKGLEFPNVYLVAWEEGLFPSPPRDDSHRSAKSEMDEERRLAYVAITRARDRLAVSHAQRRLLFRGRVETQHPSQFIAEMGDGVRKVRTQSAGSAPEPVQAPPPSRAIPMGSTLRPAVVRETPKQRGAGKGARVRHPFWGVGVVREVRGRTESASLLVDFGGNARWVTAKDVNPVS